MWPDDDDSHYVTMSDFTPGAFLYLKARKNISESSFRASKLSETALLHPVLVIGKHQQEEYRVLICLVSIKQRSVSVVRGILTYVLLSSQPLEVEA